MEYRERHRDGHYIWILSRGRPVEWDQSGRPLRSIGTDTDITLLKSVQQELAEEKERLRVTLESIGDGVISTDADSRITFMNPTAELMTGRTEAEAIGQMLTDVFEIRDQATGRPAGNPVPKCLEKGTTQQIESDATLLDRFGTIRDVRCSAAPVRTPEGKLIGAVLVFQDVTQSRALQKELAHSASHDALTGLPNRAAFERALHSVSETARTERRQHALCFIDLDRFKPVNDKAGHAAGDALLREVGEAIRRGCRANDFAARIGGDEFAVLLADCPPAHARAVAQKLADTIAAIAFTWNGKAYPIGASVGIAAITGEGPSSLGFTGEADAACYAAKAAGRGRVVLFSEIPAGKRKSLASAQ
jgi:diguanylate cyclase (GGDEF)-like protein/PAS domain S-box-containing protein